MQQVELAIVGAGIIGLAAALQLQREHHAICIIDTDEPGSGCSAGNAGYLSEGNIFPIASPGLWRALPRILLRKDGPLVIRPTYLPRLLPWAVRLIASSRPERYEAATNALAQLTTRAMQSYDRLLAGSKCSELIERCGGLHLYCSANLFEQKRASLDAIRRCGIEASCLSGNEARELEPSLVKGLAGALLFPNSGRCVNPRQLTARIAQRLVANGARLVRDRITRLERSTHGWLLHGSRSVVHARRCIVAAGRWSDRLLKPLGYRVPLEGERGYHLMLPVPGVSLHRPVVIADHHFAVTPMSDGLRLAGTVEFAAHDAPPDPRRSEMLFTQAQTVFPDLKREGASAWMGTRPSLPDSIPAIGRAARDDGLYYSFGHHHCGLTLAAVSAELLADIVAGREPCVDAAPYSLSRFD